MTFVHWRPNIVLSDFHITSIPFWVQIRGIPLEYQKRDFVEHLGSIMGPVDWIDWPTANPKNLRFARLRVRIRTHASLFMGFMLKVG